MLSRMVKCDCLIELHSAFGHVARDQQGKTHETMPNHQRGDSLLLSSKRQELGRKLAHHFALECYVIRHPESVKHREQQQWIFRRLSERFSSFDQQACLLYCRLGFWGGIALDGE